MKKPETHFKRTMEWIPLLSIAIKSRELASQAFHSENEHYRKKQEHKCFFYALLNPRLSKWWFELLKSPDFLLITKHRPRVYFKPFRPYLSIHWTKKQRAKVVLDTYRFIMKNEAFTRFITEGQIEIARFTLHENDEGILTLGYNYKYRKEGELVLFFKCSQIEGMIASAAFSFEETEENHWICRVGCIQGHKKDDSYSAKSAQKLLHGLRPKSLIVFAIQEFSRNIGLEGIYGAGDSIQMYRGKHLIHIPFLHKISFDYNTLWKESGGSLTKDGWYQLPLKQVHRDIQVIKTNKRALYLKRYTMMDDISSKIEETSKRLLS